MQLIKTTDYKSDLTDKSLYRIVLDKMELEHLLLALKAVKPAGIKPTDECDPGWQKQLTLATVRNLSALIERTQ